MKNTFYMEPLPKVGSGQHAPDVSGIQLPFAVQQQGPDDLLIILDQQSRFVALVDTDIPPDARLEHAMFIARACNSYNALLDSCRELLQLCEGGAGNVLQKMDRARAAIAKATP